jgi:shikimate dehydrogenase
VYALAGQGWQVHIAARRPDQARQLADNFAHLSLAPAAMAQPLFDAARILSRGDLDLVVNTTPLGMYPFEQASPWPARVPLPPGCAVYDLVYNPVETILLKQAKLQGLAAAGGLGMLIHQAAQAFLLWTNLPIKNFQSVVHAMHTTTQIGISATFQTSAEAPEKGQ